MALTEDQIQAFISALNERVRNLKDSEEIRCPICTNKQWQVVGDFSNFPQHSWSGTWAALEGRYVVPTIPMVCDNCGWVAHFSAKILGIEPDNVAQESAPDEGGEGN